MLDYLLRAVPLSTLEASLTANRPLQPYMDEEITHV